MPSGVSEKLWTRPPQMHRGTHAWNCDKAFQGFSMCVSQLTPHPPSDLDELHVVWGDVRGGVDVIWLKAFHSLGTEFSIFNNNSKQQVKQRGCRPGCPWCRSGHLSPHLHQEGWTRWREAPSSSDMLGVLASHLGPGSVEPGFCKDSVWLS